MTRRDDGLRLRHMLEHAREAVELAEGRTRQDLNEDRLLQLGLTRLVEIIGEAAYKVSAETRAGHPHIPWPVIVSTRHRLIHGYDSVDYDILWETVQVDMPRLVQALEALLGGEPET